MPNGAVGTNQPPSPLPMSLVGVVMPIGALNWASASCGAQLSFYLGLLQGMASKVVALPKIASVVHRVEPQ